MNKEKFLEDFKNLQTPVEILEELVDWDIKVECRCLLCGDKFKMKPANLKRGSIHKSCSIKLRGEKRNSSTDGFKEKLFKVNSDIEVLGEYTKAIIPIRVMCKICSNIWDSTPNNLLRGHGCPICRHKNAKRNTEELEKHIHDICEDFTLKFQNLIIINEPRNIREKFDCKCKQCGIVWKTSLKNLDRLKNNECCPFCSGEMVNIERVNLYLKENHILIDTIPTKWEQELSCTCLQCEYTWKIKTNNLLNSKGCPYCNKNLSNGEYVIEMFFKKFGIRYQKYKTFDSLCGIKNRRLSYDFYLEDKGLLIEYQGKQHYESVDVFGGEEYFKVQQEHDRRKREYAKNKNIKLLEIPYWQFKNIDLILSKELCL